MVQKKDLWVCYKSGEPYQCHAGFLQISQRYRDSCIYSAKRTTRKRSRYDAHIYTDEELQSFFDAVDKSQSVPDSCRIVLM